MLHSSIQHLFLLLLSTGTSHAFINQFKPVKGLADIAKAQDGTELELNLAVGEKKGAPQLTLQGLKILLSSDSLDNDDKKKKKKNKKKVSLPGAHGYFPQTSSGAQRLQITNQPGYVDMTGRQVVPLEESCWELVWKDTTPGGTLVCGFYLPESVRMHCFCGVCLFHVSNDNILTPLVVLLLLSQAQRNHATVPAGELFISIPFWEAEGLAAEQARKLATDELARTYLNQKDEEMQKMAESNNLFQKALHYRNAFEAVELYSLVPRASVKMIPSKDRVIPAGGGFLVSPKATVWTRNKKGETFELGEATIRAVAAEADDVDDTPRPRRRLI